jgi:hypothetical protein
VSERSWQREFDDPIPLPDGRTIMAMLLIVDLAFVWNPLGC